MRKAELDRAWVDCRSRPRAGLDVQSLTYLSHDQSIVLPIASRITAIVGPNGAGKTTLLRDIFSMLSHGPTRASRSRLERISGVYRGRNFDIPSQDGRPEATLLNFSNDLHLLQQYVQETPNFDELLPQAGSRQIVGHELSAYSFVSRRTYNSIEVFEIESPMDPEHELPFFVATSGARVANSKTMGFGELCACYAVWALTRIERNTAVLLDEPDSHLSPMSRAALIDYCAFVAAQKQAWIVISSHCPETVTSLETNEVLLVEEYENGANYKVQLGSNRRASLVSLGVVPRPVLLLIVEDVDAEELLRQIWARWSGPRTRAVEIRVVQGGASELGRLQELFPSASQICKLQVVLDGDKRVQTAANLLFMPSNTDPIEGARSYAQMRPDIFSSKLGIEESAAQVALRATAHADHHDVCMELAHHFGVQAIDTRRVRAALLATWLEKDDIKQEAEILANRIRTIVPDML